MGKEVKHQYSPAMRRAMYESLLLAAKNKGMTLTEYCTLWWEEDWQAAAGVFAKFLPKENTVTGKVSHDHDHHHTHAGISETTQFIDSIIGGNEAEETKH